MRLCELTIEKAAEGLRKKEFSTRDLVSSCLEAIEEEDPTFHAYLEVFEGVEAEAQARDKILADNPERLPPLFGIPIAVKDNIAIAGERLSAGSRILEHYRAAYDATVIRKLKDQGAILLGRTNMDEFAMGSSTEQSAFGPTKNPHDPARVPGGSSGGSAAAVSANLCLAALGSDTGGSIRQPAAFSGVVGLKPTYGRVSRHGLISMASSLDQIGPLAKGVADAALLLAAISGPDPFDSTAVPLPPPSGDIAPLDLTRLRIGVPKEHFVSGLDPDVEKTIRSAIQKLEAAGATVEEVSLPHGRYSLPTYYLIVPSEVSANLARYDGIRYGERQDADTLFDVYADTRARGLGPEVKRRIILGTFALSAGYYDAYYLKAQKVRRLIRQDFEETFAKVDLLMGPTTPTPAFLLGERMEDPLTMYLADIYTVAANLAGVPAISLPVGKVKRDGKELPVGLQLTGKWFEEEKLLSVAAAVEALAS